MPQICATGTLAPFATREASNYPFLILRTGSMPLTVTAAFLNCLKPGELGEPEIEELHEVVAAPQHDVLGLQVAVDDAGLKLGQAIERADGCVLRGTPDGNGSGRDWVTDCAARRPCTSN